MNNDEIAYHMMINSIIKLGIELIEGEKDRSIFIVSILKTLREKLLPEEKQHFTDLAREKLIKFSLLSHDEEDAKEEYTEEDRYNEEEEEEDTKEIVSKIFKQLGWDEENNI